MCWNCKILMWSTELISWSNSAYPQWCVSCSNYCFVVEVDHTFWSVKVTCETLSFVHVAFGNICLDKGNNFNDVEVNSHRIFTLMFDTPLHTVAAGCKTGVLFDTSDNCSSYWVKVSDRHIRLGIRTFSFFGPLSTKFLCLLTSMSIHFTVG